METEGIKFGKRLKTAREAEGLLQKDLAARLGVVQGTVCNWEHGLRDLPTAHIMKVCEILNTTPDYLFGATEYVHPQLNKGSGKATGPEVHQLLRGMQRTITVLRLENQQLRECVS